jgi:hypothetical protein
MTTASDTLFPIRTRHGRSPKTGYINSQDDVVIPPAFDDGKPFREGLAAVKLNATWGFINPVGELVIAP